jgi:hypothetical protein
MDLDTPPLENAAESGSRLAAPENQGVKAEVPQRVRT